MKIINTITSENIIIANKKNDFEAWGLLPREQINIITIAQIYISLIKPKIKSPYSPNGGLLNSLICVLKNENAK